ncbi:primosomal protein N' [Alcaligenes endophyticus]|uniref:Replication restart protein PriA n=1 Tax=Alcaligenes endophyticus TaxID=1929088 RepID=A0ABT8EG50_9BURK|nr:primosomal protein N' [Alcaligenes endophyticus]MCX5590067.1 primosomal protein N' [Alcaligenes endophyticus]MDN4120270.1 primosomal protein N' [Alcaligenes endophyticus]
MSTSVSLSVTLPAESKNSGSEHHWLHVALDVPLMGVFDYSHTQPVAVGMRVIVGFGRRKMVGIVVANPAVPDYPAEQVKAIDAVLDDLPPLPADWLRMAHFAAAYYQRPLGEVMLPALPGPLRKVAAYQGKRSAGGPVMRLERRKAPKAVLASADTSHELNAEQAHAVEQISQIQGHTTVLLHGVTGSGKTEVYMRALVQVLEAGKQVLFMVPEINLTPQFEQVLRARLASVAQGDVLAVLHSGLADGERLRNWLRTSRGEARVLLGTRLSIFTPMPDLGLIIVDEEHDTSYKQQDGLRYSARDLAIWRGHDRQVPVVLGSATPSLESWNHAQQGRYHLLSLTQRARAVSLPRIRLVDTRYLRLEQGFSPQLLDALKECLARQEQALVFLNRRGYAPVLHCVSCGWLSRCPRCSVYAVLHRVNQKRHYLQCHHCGHQAPVPRACPDCGDQDLQGMGRGTQRVEEYLAEHFPQARIMRIDADSTRLKGSAQQLFEQVHAGEVDIMVGTQMVAKGHDFTRLSVVGVLNADNMLFAHDFRAPERLFAQLMQVAGRAGRHTEGADVIIQTAYPEQPLYQNLIRHDYIGFAQAGLAERESIGLPPYAYQALLTAEAGQLSQTLQFLSAARQLPEQSATPLPGAEHVFLYDPVPLRVVRVAHVERAQLLVESARRPALQAFLQAWEPALALLAKQNKVRYTVEVDPLEI